MLQAPCLLSPSLLSPCLIRVKQALSASIVASVVFCQVSNNVVIAVIRGCIRYENCLHDVCYELQNAQHTQKQWTAARLPVL